MSVSLPWLAPDRLDFPPLDQALRDPDGLLAAGGDLSPERMVEAYRRGIFPWFQEGQPILWWSPDPRCILLPGEVHISKNLKKLIRQQRYRISLNTCFEEVVYRCAQTRETGPGTWITQGMYEAYLRLHEMGVAHALEVWNGQDELVGGLYGLALGRVFFGESMFSLVPNTSKLALVALCEQMQARGGILIDCQVESTHLRAMGAKPVPRDDFVRLLAEGLASTTESLSVFSHTEAE